MNTHDRSLGMDRTITRRDFLNGVSVALTSSLVAPPWLEAFGLGTGGQAPEQAAGYYPPALTGMRGSHPGSFEVAHALRDKGSWEGDATDTGESYDLIVVGGGLSGLAAAYFFRADVGSHARILVLDNHDDFGGHAKRNEFRHEGRLLILNGGTSNIEGGSQYSPQSQGLLRAIGIDLERFLKETAPDRELYRSLNLRSGVFFGKEKFGVDRLVVGMPGGRGRAQGAANAASWREFLAKTPLSEQAQQDIVRLESDAQPDYMPGLSSDAKKERLIRMSYLDFLLNVAKVHPDAAWLYQTRASRFMMLSDGVPAYYCWNMGFPGFQGMKLEPTPPEVLVHEPGGMHGRENQERADRGLPTIEYPDGNATIARLLVRSLVPDAVPGRSQEDVVTARVDYGRLDRDGIPARIRLNSTAVRVRHTGDPATAREVLVTYVKQGKAQSVRGKHCVLACFNSIIPYICPELPAPQKEALAYGIRGVNCSTNVLIRNWTSFAKLGVANISAPGSYFESVGLSRTISLGDYRCPHTPDEPMVISLGRTWCAPGKPRAEQHRLGRMELLQTTFETFERQIRDELGRALGSAGFDPAKDIEAVTVNRWPHGYTVNPNTLWDPVEWALSTPDDRPCVVGRKRFGRISIANADAASSPHTDAAFDMAYRAVREAIESRTSDYISTFKQT